MLKSRNPVSFLLINPHTFSSYLGISNKVMDTQLPTKVGSPLFAIPNEVFDMILENTPQKAIMALSLTCTAIQSHPSVQKYIYMEPFRKDDLPDSNYAEYLVTHKDRFDSIIRGINVETGIFVRCLTVYQWTMPQHLSLLARFCPNLDTVDFSAVVEPIDYLNRRQLKLPHPPCTHHPKAQRYRPSCFDCLTQFRWAVMLQLCPEFFNKIRTLKVNYGFSWTSTSRLSFQDRLLIREAPTQFSLLLRSCPQLETLRLSGTSVENHFDTDLKMITLQEQIIGSASESLKTIGLSNCPVVFWKLDAFLEGFQPINCRAFEISLHHDLQKHGGTFKKRYEGRNLVCELVSRNYSTKTYLRAISSAKAQVWDVSTTDAGDDFPTRPIGYLNLIGGGAKNYTSFLVKTLHWTPLFTWEHHMPNYSSWVAHSVLREFGCPEGRWPSNYNLSPIRNLFQQLKSFNTPVRILLTPGKYDHGAFFWFDRYNKGNDFVQRSEQFDSLDENEENDPDVENTLYPDEEQFAKNEMDFWDKAVHLDARSWNLHQVSDLVDEVRLIWNDSFGLSGGSELDLLEIKRPSGVGLLSRRGKDILPLRLAHEAKRMAPFFKLLKHNFPTLTRFALYIPTALYPDHDQQFIDLCLPGLGWSVAHCGSGGGGEQPKKVEKYFDNYHHPCGQDKAYYNEAWDDVRLYANEKEKDLARCPMIHRVFTRKLGVSKAPVLHDEVYRTKRPQRDLRFLGMVDCIRNADTGIPYLGSRNKPIPVD